MQIRLATRQDLTALMALVRRVVPLMRSAGNLQWDENYPNEAVFERDIDLRQLWIAEIGPDIAGIAAITMDQEPDYAQVGSRSTVRGKDPRPSRLSGAARTLSWLSLRPVPIDVS